MKTNNKGFSYVELLLVIAIMAVMVGIISLSMGLVNRANVNRGIEKISSTLNQARNASMAKGTVKGTFQITLSDGKYYFYVGDVTASNYNELKEDLISSPATVGYYVQGEDAIHMVTADAPLTLQYNQSTGAFKAMADGSYCSSIVLINGDKEVMIKLYPETGKTELVY